MNKSKALKLKGILSDLKPYTEHIESIEALENAI